MFVIMRTHVRYFALFLWLYLTLLGCPFNQREIVVSSYVIKPAAHIDLVPYQTLNGPTDIGVVAFHKDGINKVVFRFTDNSGSSATLESSIMTLNNRTGVNEYWVTFDPSGFEDGEIHILAEVIPNGTGSRSLESVVFNNSGSSLTGRTFYINPNEGDDQNNDGLDSTRPFRTIARALDYETISGGDTVILLVEGEYIAPDRTHIPGHHFSYVNKYVTIRPLTSDMNVIIKGDPAVSDRINPKVSHIKWENVTLDFTDLNDYYRYITREQEYHWLDHCKVIDNMPWSEMEDTGYLGNFSEAGYYATDSTVIRSKYGFTFARLVRNCHIFNITGDCYQMTKCLLNSSVENVDGAILEHHTDIYQIWDETDNIVMYGLTATSIFAQNFMLEPDRENVPGRESLTNSAFVDISISNYYSNGKGPAGGPPWSHLAGGFMHVLFYDVNIPDQRFCFRTDSLEQPFTGEDVIIKDSTLVFDPNADYRAENPPNGVTLIDCTILYPPLD